MGHGKAGFTLIELMIVVAIIGVLAAIATPKFSNLIARSRDAATLGNLGVLRSTLGIYYADTGGLYPSFAPPFGQAAGYGTILQDSLVPRYIAAIPNATPSGSHHPASNQVDDVWNQTGSEDDEGNNYGQGWKYDANPFDVGQFPGYPEFGSIMVLCTHNNASGKNWTTY